jgi:hypothetical protein
VRQKRLCGNAIQLRDTVCRHTGKQSPASGFEPSPWAIPGRNGGGGIWVCAFGIAHRCVSACLRADYPNGAPATGYLPLLALLPWKVSVDEAAMIASDLLARRSRSIDAADVGVEIIRVTGEMPSLDDIESVQHRLDAMGSM